LESEVIQKGLERRNLEEGKEKKGRISNLTATVKIENPPKDHPKELELPPELQRLLEEAEKVKQERNLQRLAELFKGARWYEVELPQLMELYRRDRELCKLVERVLLLSDRRIDDVVKRTMRIPLLPSQLEFLARYLKLRSVS